MHSPLTSKHDRLRAIQVPIYADYTFVKQIQQSGQFATVNKIKRKSDGKTFVVKSICKSQTNINHVRREIDIMSKLNHKYIIKIHEKHETYSSINIIMPECVGGTLFDRIKSKERYTENEAKSVIRKLCSALFYMHNEQRIVHSDLKPENILMISKEENSDIKLIDFGQSQYLRRFFSLYGMCGTCYYTAPEVIRNEGYSSGIDMWSVGVITYAMIFGFPPFCVDTNKYFGQNERAEIYKKILLGFSPVIKDGFGAWYPKQLVGAISRECLSFMSECMETDTRKRLSAKKALQHPWVVGSYSERKYGKVSENKFSFFDNFTSSDLECCLNVFL